MEVATERLVRIAPMVAAIGAVALLSDEVAHASGLGPALVGGLVLGALARGLRVAGFPRAAPVASAVVACFGLGLLGWKLASHLALYDLPGEWRLAVSTILRQSAPLAVALVALTWRRGLAPFAVGAALVTGVASWSVPPQGALAVLAFLFARDVGSVDRGVPARQSLALVGVGVLSALLALALTFDLAASVCGARVTDGLTYWFVIDGAITRWPRIAVEAAVLAGCFAHARGRSWGVLALSVLGPTLVAMVATTDRLPAWGGGCIGLSHPLDGGREVLVLFLAVAVVPWLAPLARALRAPR